MGVVCGWFMARLWFGLVLGIPWLGDMLMSSPSRCVQPTSGRLGKICSFCALKDSRRVKRSSLDSEERDIVVTTESGRGRRNHRVCVESIL